MMMFYILSIMLPTIAVICCLIYDKTKVHIGEVIMMYFGWFIIVTLFGLISSMVTNRATEYLGDLITKATYYEDWDELVTYTTESCNSKGVCHTETHTRVDYHPEEFQMESSTGNSYLIDKDEYYRIVKRWGGKQTFEDMHRDYDTNDGDAYFCVWNNIEISAIPITWEHTYKNKVASSNDVFNYPDVSNDDVKHYGLYKYPPIDDLTQKCILGFNDPNAEKKFDFINGYYGPIKQIKCFILVYKNKPQMAGKLQEALWKGGNKNELIYCIGIDSSNNVTWANVISWCENQEMKIAAKDYITSMGKLNLVSLADYTKNTVIPKYKRKEFKDFEYIQNAPNHVACSVLFILLTIYCGIMSIFIITNDFDYNNDLSIKYRYRR